LLYIRPTGETALETTFAWGEKFCENVAVVKPDLRLKRYGAINRDGQIVIKPTYRFLGNCSNGLLPAQREDGSWIYVRSNGEELSATYEFVSGFVDNFASVSINGKFTLLNQNLNPISPPHDFRIITLKNAILVSADQSAKIPIETIAANRRLQGIPLTSLNQFEPMIVQLDTDGPTQVDEQSGRPRRLSSDPTVEVSLISNPEKADIYRPSKWEFERAERSGDIEKLLTPDFRCPITTSDKCKFSKYMDYRLIFVLGNKIEVRKCIPSIDPKIEVIFK
jgi:hypothetical protein